nr:MAG: dynein-like beta chain protein [Diabrotica toursvirus 3a]
MKINNKEFTLYNSDTDQTIKSRIASFFNTVPYWLDQYGDPEDVTVINILDDLKNFITEIVSFKDVESRYCRWIEYKRDDAIDASSELAKMVIVFYTMEYGNSAESKIMLEEIFRESGGTEFTWDFIENIVRNRDLILQKLYSDIKENKRQASLNETEFKKTEQFMDVISDIKISHFIEQSITSTSMIKTETHVYLKYVFGLMKVYDNLLFARYENFFIGNEKNKKYFKKYDVEDIHPGYKNTMILVLVIETGYNEVVIKEIDSTTFIIETDSTFEYGFIKDLLMTDFKITSTENTKISGYFEILNKNFHKDLFLDEIMNNPQFLNFYTNERFKVSKMFSRLNLFYYSLKTGTVNFSMRNEDNNILIKIKKINSYESITAFMDFFTKIFKVYKSKERSLFAEYTKFIPGINLTVVIRNEPKTTGVIKKNQLSIIEPSLFVPLYSRKCSKPPRIVESEEDVPKGFQFMKYPLYKEGGLKPRIYICDRLDEYVYPGLRKNSLSNKNVFPYIPCCDKTDQTDRTSPLNKYLRQENPNARNDKYEHVLYRTYRIIPNENKGILPPGISKVVNGCFRYGVFVGPNSFIDCISRITGIENDNITNEELRQRQLKEIRLKLIPEFCAQNNYDIKDYINKWFRNTDEYFEPRRFYRAVEEYFKVNIYIFEKSADYVSEIQPMKFIKTVSHNGILSKPHMPSRGTFIDPKRFTKSAYVYLHMGGAVDTVRYPHCEYIQGDEERQINHTLIEKIYRNLLIFSRTDFIRDSHAISQFLDSSGRVCKLRLPSGEIQTLRKPMLPLGIPIEEIEHKPEKNMLSEHVYKKRFTRIFLEYVIIKYAVSKYDNLEEFINKSFVVDPTWVYLEIVPGAFVEDYDNVFTRDGKIMFESEDTMKRIIYSMSILIKRENPKDKYISYPYFITSYFASVMDFDQKLVLNENSFKEFAYENPQGKTFNNSLEDPQRETLIIFKENNIPELNGYFKVYSSLNELEEGVIENEVDKYFLWDQGLKQYNVCPGRSRVIIIFKFNSIYYYFVKISNYD